MMNRLSFTAFILACLAVAPTLLLAGPPTTKGFAPIADRPGDYGVSLEVAGGKSRFKLGETLSLRFKCSVEGYLTIVSIDAAGDVVLMFPNQWAPKSKVPADRRIEIPGRKAGFKLTAQPPLGTTYVRAYMTPKPLVSVTQARTAHAEAFSLIGKADGARMRSINSEILGFVPQPDQPPEADAIAVVTLRLSIVSNNPRNAGGKLPGEIPEGADLDHLTPNAHPKAKLIADLRDAKIGYSKGHEKGLVIPPTFSFDAPGGGTTLANDEEVVETQRETMIEFLVEPDQVVGGEGDRLRAVTVERVRVGGRRGIADARKTLQRRGSRTVQQSVRYWPEGGEFRNEPMLALQWALNNRYMSGVETGALDALDTAVQRPIIVAVIDTGMCADHPDLSQALYRNEREVPGNGMDDDRNGLVDDAVGYDFLENHGGLLPGVSRHHGTFVSSVIAARPDGRGTLGVCPWAEILPIRAGSARQGFPTQAVVPALVYAADSGAKIVNCSWGGGGYDPLLFRALQYLEEKGVLVVCSAGNSHNDNDVMPHLPDGYPLDNIISVAALRVDGKLASFSCWGANSVDLAAPGELILGYADGSGNAVAWDGTSFSAPMVAGAAALVWAKHPDWDYRQVRAALLGSVKKTNDLKGRVITGGMLDIAAAIER